VTVSACCVLGDYRAREVRRQPFRPEAHELGEVPLNSMRGPELLEPPFGPTSDLVNKVRNAEPANLLAAD
jgi:hypothetical protein